MRNIPTFRASLQCISQAIFMKTLTCKQIGGVCDTEIKGETSGELATAASEHILEEAKTDKAHEESAKEMKAIYEDKDRHAKWEKEFQEKWNAAPVL